MHIFDLHMLFSAECLVLNHDPQLPTVNYKIVMRVGPLRHRVAHNMQQCQLVKLSGLLSSWPVSSASVLATLAYGRHTRRSDAGCPALERVVLSVYFRTHVLLADNFADKRARLVSRHSFVGTLRLVVGYCEPGSISHSGSRQ